MRNATPDSETLSLAGTWEFALDPENIGMAEGWPDQNLADTIQIPGTTDEQQKGTANPERSLLHLTRVYPYIGPAFYRKEVTIPPAWQDCHIFFRMERTKHSTVWVDGELAGSRDSLTTTHTYDLSTLLKPGTHNLTVRIDNSDLPPVGDGHQLCEHTQTNWNGMLGRVELEARPSCHISDLQAWPDPETQQLKLSLTLNRLGKGTLAVSAASENVDAPHTFAETFPDRTSGDDGQLEVVLPTGDGLQRWDAFHPTLYRVQVSFTHDTGTDTREIRIGFRSFVAEEGQFKVNGRPTLLRGKHDACVFPLTGYAPMDKAEWKRVLTIARSYGINHYRFHSYCPPRAAFEAADEVGMYLQPELPFWEGIGKCDLDPMGDVEFRVSNDESVMDARIRYLIAEGMRILHAFGNHPSFCMFSLGNELAGDLETMASLVRRFRREDDRHLYAHGSNNFIFEPTRGPADDYWTTMMTGGHYRRGKFEPDSFGREVRGSFCSHSHGHINNCYPGTETDYSSALEGVHIPVIGHEVGQYQVYPNFREIDRYTGVLQARNFEVFRENLERAGMLPLADDFFRASGALAVLCYREDIEAALRTPGFGGFQLLDLQDFPGQGTALVGILDAFMESKGLVAPEEWREFCDDVVLLARFPKYTWTTEEVFRAVPSVADYGHDCLQGRTMAWRLITEEDEVIASGQIQAAGNCNPMPYEPIEVNLAALWGPQRLQLSLSLEGTEYRNQYSLWVYSDTEAGPTDVLVTSSLEAALPALEEGRAVVLCPESVEHSIPGAFQPDFWCYPMFKKYNPPGTLGILCDPGHPALAAFPTEYHANWQWWPLMKNGCAMILDSLPESLHPIVRVIDNFERNHRLASIFECTAGKGKLIVCSCALLSQQQYPEARQLLRSLVAYAESDAFRPGTHISTDTLSELIGTDRDRSPKSAPSVGDSRAQ